MGEGGREGVYVNHVEGKKVDVIGYRVAKRGEKG